MLCYYSWRVSRSTVQANHCSHLGTAGGGRKLEWSQNNDALENNKNQSGGKWNKVAGTGKVKMQNKESGLQEGKRQTGIMDESHIPVHF